MKKATTAAARKGRTVVQIFEKKKIIEITARNLENNFRPVTFNKK